MLTASIKRNDTRARWLIGIVSVVVFTVVVILSQVKLDANLGFNPHIFAKANAVINSLVAVLLIAGLFSIKAGKQLQHKRIMVSAIILSVLFLVSYICHHLLSGDTRFGDLDHNGILSEAERTTAGSARMIYIIILLTHIPLAGIILPFILFTAYRALTADYSAHKKLARITWPIWLYVSITGVIVYIMISPYYG
ncbi:MAG: DUF420 domain-containing protein [Chitinophagaceae bacterium]|nr:DUF420 domain-containing protein [Chitinophagaceae bacterium]